MSLLAVLLFLSTLSLRRATANAVDQILPGHISIHALLAESDYIGSYGPNFSRISIHALLAESDQTAYCFLSDGIEFLSTLSLRRATPSKTRRLTNMMISIHALLAESDNTSIAGRITSNDFYPRSPCGERRDPGANNRPEQISIHALLAESDMSKRLIELWKLNFYPRSPCGERPDFRRYIGSNMPFLSTLSLRRATSIRHIGKARSEHFYPRSPCGERQPTTGRNNKNNVFLSTLSLRRATTRSASSLPSISISIHALLAESDIRQYSKPDSGRNFYPRSPCGERPSTPTTVLTLICISIHALLAESDLNCSRNGFAIL